MDCDTLITSIGLIPERELAEEAAADGRFPDWLFLCGNACYVHDLVDDVTYEAEKIGQQAADYVQNGRLRKDSIVSIHQHETLDSGIFCLACPKACRLTKTENGFIGAACGRKDPIPSKLP